MRTNGQASGRIEVAVFVCVIVLIGGLVAALLLSPKGATSSAIVSYKVDGLPAQTHVAWRIESRDEYLDASASEILKSIPGNASFVSLAGYRHADDVLLGLADRPIESLDLSRTALTDVGWGALNNFRRLRSLNASGVPKAASKVPQDVLSNLHTLAVDGCGATDDDVLRLCSGKNLTSLSIANNKVSDFKCIDNLSMLEQLDISGTQVSTDSVVTIVQLPALIRLIGRECGLVDWFQISTVAPGPRLSLIDVRPTTCRAISSLTTSRLWAGVRVKCDE